MKNVKCTFPDIEIECPECDIETEISGDEFEKSMDMKYYAVGSTVCLNCGKSFSVTVGG